MSRYIDADALIDALYREKRNALMQDHNSVARGIQASINCISNTPTIEPKRGEWIEENGRVICSECRCNALRTMTGCLMDRHLDYNKSNFCPNCGCAMTKESK